MKKLLKCLMLSLVLSVFFGMTSMAAVNKVSITKPTKKSSITINRGKKNVKTSIKVDVKVTKGSSKAVTFKSSNSKVVSVSSKGVMTCKAPGKAKITVTSKADKKKKATLTVKVVQKTVSLKAQTKSGAPISKNSLKIVKGKTVQVQTVTTPAKVSNNKVTWKSNNKNVKVDSKGKIKANKTGKSTVTATAKDGSKKKVSFTVTVVDKKKAVTSVAISNKDIQLYIDGSSAEKAAKIKTTIKPNKPANKVLAYKSSNSKVATVDQKGNVKAVGLGSTTITATSTDGTNKKATAKVTVSKKVIPVASVGLNTKAATLATHVDYGYNTSVALKATVTPATATDKTVTYTSSNASVATVASNGLVSARGTGKATITAKAGDKSATAVINVVDGRIVNLKKEFTTETKELVAGANVSVSFSNPELALNSAETLANAAPSILGSINTPKGRDIKRNDGMIYNVKFVGDVGSKKFNVTRKWDNTAVDLKGKLAKLSINKGKSREVDLARLNDKLTTLSNSIVTGGPWNFGNATIQIGNKQYQVNNIVFDGDAVTANVVGVGTVRAAFSTESNNTAVYISSEGNLQGLEDSLKELCGAYVDITK